MQWVLHERDIYIKMLYAEQKHITLIPEWWDEIEIRITFLLKMLNVINWFGTNETHKTLQLHVTKTEEN